MPSLQRLCNSRVDTDDLAQWVSLPIAEHEWKSLLLDFPKDREPFGKAVSCTMVPAAHPTWLSSEIFCGFLPPSRPHLLLTGNFRILSCAYLTFQTLPSKSGVKLLCLWDSLFSPLPDFNLQMNSSWLTADI